MHFLEAHKIVHEFAGAIGRERNCMLIPYSWVNRTDQELIDAFVIFLGHMVMWQTRTNEEYDKYRILMMQIYNVVPDDMYNQIVDANKILEKADHNPIYKIANRQKIEAAEKIHRTEMELAISGHKQHEARVKRIDLGALVGEFQDYKMNYANSPKETRKEFDFFMDDYIQLVYGKTSYKEPSSEDYCCFWSFDDMRKMLEDFDGLAPVAKKVYSEYRDYIMTKQ